MSTQLYRPYNLFNPFESELSQLFKAREGQKTETENKDWTPTVDIIETKDSFLLSLDLPGIDLKSVAIECHEGILSVKGERQERQLSEDQNIKRNEKPTGVFNRKFTLPDNVNVDNINATGALGVLDITIPKQAKSQPKVISVTEVPA